MSTFVQCVAQECLVSSQRQMAMQRACSRFKQRHYGDGDRVPYTYQTRWSSLVTDCNSVKSNHNQQVGLRRSDGGKSGREEEGRDMQEKQFIWRRCFYMYSKEINK